MLNNIRLILVNTSHPGNIGSAARAIKTMGLGNLYLVTPKLYPHDKAVEMASGATDILDQAIVTDSLEAAIHGCTLVAGTSTRERTVAWPQFTPKQFAEKAKMEAAQGTIAIVFGQEQSGLTNAELQRCQVCIQIPANPNYSSLNLAAAVQVISYELYCASLTEVNSYELREDPLASAEEMERFYIHLRQVLAEIDFLKGKPSPKLMARLRRLFNRARPDVREMNILRGILTGVQESYKTK